MPRPVLDDLELQQVQDIATSEDEALAEHAVPALEGDFFQHLGRRATGISLQGVLTGTEVKAALEKLREKFRAATPVSFVADITTATRIEKVLIEELDVRELAGKPERFEYAFKLREFIVPPEPEEEEPPPIRPEPVPETATLEINVIVEGEPNFDFSKVTVTVEGTKEDGTTLSRTLTNHENNVWKEADFPSGNYAAKAVVTEPPAMAGSEPVIVPAAGTAQATITLKRDQQTIVAKAFVVHFRFDKSFVEPCMRHVLSRVAQYAGEHSDEKILIVGHTDKSGSEAYNLSLGERRARSVYAYLTFGRDRAVALAEWNTLRQQAVGGLPSIKDSWGTREYQYMLQDLGFHSGNVNGNHDAPTDSAVRAFQQGKGLVVDGIVGDATWAALIEAYLSQDNFAVPENQFLPNAKDGCNGGIIKWLGCGEEMPLPTTPGAQTPTPLFPAPSCAPEIAWRPNRRTEILFVQADALICDVPKPVTFDLPTPNAVGPTWCLGPGDPNERSCFITRDPSEQGKWLVQPAEPGTVTVRGSIKQQDGTPVPNARYVLIASDGEFLHKDASENPNLGEVLCGNDRGRPNPVFNRTDVNGLFSYPRQTPVGVYTLEIQEPVVARLAEEPPEAAKGNVVCKRLEGASDFDVIVLAGAAGRIRVLPTITPASQTIVVKKPYTNPARQMVTLRTASAFDGSGTFTRSSNTVRFFSALVGGTEVTFNGTDNVFTGAQLTAGVQLFAEGASASAALNDIQLSLSLTPGSAPVGPPALATMTAVELTLDIFMSRTTAGVDPAPLPQPTTALPPPGTPNDKWFGGRFVHVQDPGNHHGRALLIIRQVQPVAFAGDLVLRQVAVTGNNPTGLGARIQVFDNELPTAGEAAKANPQEFNASTIPAAGLRFFVEGRNVSAVLRDTGFQFGVKNLEDDGDRVRMTAIRFNNLQANIPSTPPNSPRLGNGPVPNSQLTRGVGAALVASDFDVDFTKNIPLVLIQSALPAGNQINLSIDVAPAGVPVSWSVLRDVRPLPPGPPPAGAVPNAGDDPRIVALSPNPVPTLVQNAVNPLLATLADDAVGSFHIRPFVDVNGSGQFEPVQSTEPFILMNLVLIQIGGPGSTNSSLAQPANIGLGPFAGPPPAPGAVFAPTAATGLQVATGSFVGPITAGVRNDATVVVIGGGNIGTRGLDRLFGGWINNELAVATSPTVPPGEDVVAQYLDATPPLPPRTHQRISIWTSPRPVFLFGPGGPAPALVAGPVLDTTNFGNEGTGGNRAVGTEGAVGPPVPITRTARIPAAGLPQLGEIWRVQMWDSPGDSCPPAHGFFPGTLVNYRFNLDFRSDLCFWTNVTGAPVPTPGPITGAAPPTPDAACCFYASVQTNTWQIRIAFTFNPATGVSTPAPGNTILLQQDPAPTRFARAVQPTEVRAPISLNLLATDART